MPSPKFLIDFYLTSTKHYADDDVYYNNVLYEKRLRNVPAVTKALSDQANQTFTLTVELSNADGEFSNLDDAGEEFRGKAMKIMKYDPTLTAGPDYGEDGFGPGGYGGGIPLPRFELYGKVIRPNILEKSAFFDILIGDPDALQTILPKKILENSDFASDRPTATYRPSQDLGKPYSIPIGHSKKIRCPALYFDPVANTYDFLIGYGTIASNNTNKTDTVNVYRDKKLISSSEYTIYDGSQGSPYTGYAFIRFTNPQYVYDSSGSFYEIEIDCYGLKMSGGNVERNGVNIIKNILSDTTWGLGETINAGSFGSASSYVTNLLFDGAITTQRKAQDIIKEFRDGCFVEKLEKNESGEWIIEVDHYQSWIDASFGYKDGFYENIIDITLNEILPTNEAVKDICLKYGYNPWTNIYKYPNKRTVNAFGEDRTLECNFIRDHETADRITCRMQKSMQEKKKRMGITAGNDGEHLREGNIISIDIPPLKRTGNFKVMEIERGKNSFPLIIQSYSSTIYDYIVGTIPGEGISDEEPDYNNTDPLTPTSFILVSQTNGAWTAGTYQGTDGGTLAYAEFSAVRPSVNFTHMIFGYKKQGDTIPYTYGEGNLDTGSTWKGTIRGLIPGIAYDFCARAVNSTTGLKSALAIILNTTAPGDTTIPATPTGLVATAGLKSITIDWADNTEKTLSYYEVYRGTSTNPTTKIGTAKASTYVDDKVSHATLYYYRVRAFSRSGIASEYSSNVNATPSYVASGNVNFYWAGGQSAGGPPTYIDDSICQIGTNVDIYGNIRMMNRQDIYFYTDAGSTYGGAIYLNGTTFVMASAGNIEVSGTAIFINGLLWLDNVTDGAPSGTTYRKVPVYNGTGTLKGYITLTHTA